MLARRGVKAGRAGPGLDPGERLFTEPQGANAAERAKEAQWMGAWPAALDTVRAGLWAVGRGVGSWGTPGASACWDQTRARVK